MLKLNGLSVVFWVGLLVAGSAQGAESASPLLLLPLTRDAKPNGVLTQGVSDTLLRMGEDPERPRRPLSQDELSCQKTSCLSVLARRLRVMRILGGSVVASDQRRYSAKVFVYSDAARRIITHDGACEDCTERQLSALVASLAAKLVESAAAAALRSPEALPAAPVAPVSMPPAAVPPRATESALASQVERRLSELVELVRAQSSTLGKVGDAVTTAALVDDVNGRLFESARANLAIVRAGQEKLSDSTVKHRELTEKLRDTLERQRETAEKVRDSADKSRDSSDRAREGADKAVAGMERLRIAVDSARDALDLERAAAQAADAKAEKLVPLIERAVHAADVARDESARAQAESVQTALVAGKTLKSIEQLNAISSDLHSALTNVEPLRAAAEQTQQVATDNAAQSADLLRLIQEQKSAADQTLIQARQVLGQVRDQAGHRGLTRRRKVAAGILGGLLGAALSATITLSALKADEFSSRDINVGYALSALLGGATVAVLATPAR